MKKYLFCFLFLLTLRAFSQNTEAGIQVGVGFFAMKEFKAINEKAQKELPFETKITDNFPANIVFKGYYHHTYQNNFGIGFRISYSSTGSLISREDYSGSYYFKNQVHFFSPGLMLDYCVYSLPRFRIVLYNEIGWEFCYGKLHENLTVLGYTQDQSYEYRSINVFIEPGFKVLYPFNNSISFGLYAGYLIDSNSDIKSRESSFSFKELYSVSHGNNSCNWSGLRFGVSIAYKL